MRSRARIHSLRTPRASPEDRPVTRPASLLNPKSVQAGLREGVGQTKNKNMSKQKISDAVKREVLAALSIMHAESYDALQAAATEIERQKALNQITRLIVAMNVVREM
jgi:hypothetical protein